MAASPPLEWGDYSIVAGARRALEHVHETLDYDWLVILSGQDYPLKPVREIESDLALSGYDFFADVDAVVDPPARDAGARADGTDLAQRYFFSYAKLPAAALGAPAPLRRLARGAARELTTRQRWVAAHPMPPGVPWRVGVRRRATPFTPHRPCRKGSFWMSLSRRAVSELLMALDGEPRLAKYYERTILPDESLIPTVLHALPGLRAAPDARRYTSWPRPGASSPEVLTRRHLPGLLASGAHFARKFDEEVDPEVLDELDEQLVAH